MKLWKQYLLIALTSFSLMAPTDALACFGGGGFFLRIGMHGGCGPCGGGFRMRAKFVRKRCFGCRGQRVVVRVRANGNRVRVRVRA